MNKVHSFPDSLELSKLLEKEPWWEELYKIYFPNFSVMANVPEPGWAQIGGVDRVITLRSSKRVIIEEKVRHKDYGDFFLETWSDKKNKKLGWIEKDLACDFIAYVILPKKTCYLLPYLLLRKVWIKNKEFWIKKFKETPSKNEGYTTIGCCVPKVVLLTAIKDSMKFEFTI